MPTSHSALSPNLSRNRTVTKPSVRTKGGIVVAQNRCAAEIGARVLSEGGHAVDAAVATAFALGVVEPWMSGIGGVGAMLIHDAKSGAVGGIDFGGCAPEALDPADFPLLGGKDSDLFGWPAVKDNRNTIGAKAVVAPTEPAGLAFAHKKHGRKPWRDLLAPAVKLAEDGPIVDWHTTLVIASAMADLSKNPAARARFLPTGFPPDAPHASSTTQLRLPMKDLAKTLATLAADGADALYKGALAKSIAADVKAMGGYLSERDLASVTPREVTPREIAHGRSTIHVLPELNGGPTLAVAYAELARLRKATEANPGAETFTHYAEAMRAGWKHRFEKMGDAGELTAPTSTTHLCVVDRDGNMVTLTQTLLSLFGARIVLPGTGILMNNGINWFDPRPGGPNAIAPSRRVQGMNEGATEPTHPWSEAVAEEGIA